MSVTSRSLNLYINKYFGSILENENLTEIWYNGENKIFTLDGLGNKQTHETLLDFKSAMSIVSAVSSPKNTEVNENKPILSATLTNDERVQIVLPPATKNDVISITIRKPSKRKISMEEYQEQKIFDIASSVDKKEDTLMPLYIHKKYREFIENAVLQGKSIVVSGATGSGKTTFMKTLIDYIPPTERIISIEDVEELTFTKHENHVQLFYPSEAKAGDFLTAASLLKSCLRMKPDRIILAELRGGETFDFVNVINSGHGGSITSCHAGSVEETFSRLALMTLQNESGQKIPFAVIQKTLRDTIDIVIHMELTKKGRRITEVYYKNHEEKFKNKEAV